MAHDTFTIDSRFQGPDGMVNGGYVAGAVAEAIGGPAMIRLKAPTPFDAPLRLESEPGIYRLSAGDTLLVEGEPLGKPLDLDLPSRPSSAEIAQARSNFPDRENHMAPRCFVCGIERRAEDALCLFSGVHPQLGRAMAHWTPSADYAAADGLIAPRILWAALDCPSYFALDIHDRTALLGGMAAIIQRRPRPGERLAVTAWPLERDGRKLHAGSVIHDEAGIAIAMARALWVDVGPVTSG